MQAATKMQLKVHNIAKRNLQHKVRNTQQHVPAKLKKLQPLHEAEI